MPGMSAGLSHTLQAAPHGSMALQLGHTHPPAGHKGYAAGPGLHVCVLALRPCAGKSAPLPTGARLRRCNPCTAPRAACLEGGAQHRALQRAAARHRLLGVESAAGLAAKELSQLLEHSGHARGAANHLHICDLAGLQARICQGLQWQQRTRRGFVLGGRSTQGRAGVHTVGSPLDVSKASREPSKGGCTQYLLLKHSTTEPLPAHPQPAALHCFPGQAQHLAIPTPACRLLPTRYGPSRKLASLQPFGPLPAPHTNPHTPRGGGACSSRAHTHTHTPPPPTTPLVACRPDPQDPGQHCAGEEPHRARHLLVREGGAGVGEGKRAPAMGAAAFVGEGWTLGVG